MVLTPVVVDAVQGDVPKGRRARSSLWGWMLLRRATPVCGRALR